MLAQPPDEYKGEFPPDDPRLPDLTAAHETFLASLARYDSHRQVPQMAMEAFDRKNAGMVDLHKRRIGLLGGPDDGMQSGAPMFEPPNDDDDGDFAWWGAHLPHRAPQPYDWNHCLLYTSDAADE